MRKPRPRFEVLKMRVNRGANGSSVTVTQRLNRALKASQRLVYLKHNTLLGRYGYWTAIVENT